MALVAATLVPNAIASPRVASETDLARSAAAAVRGRVVAVVSQWEGGAIYTWVSIAVERAWGLDPADGHVVVKQLGGVAGDTALVVGGQTPLAAGDEVFLLLDVRPRDRTLTVAGLGHGVWRANGGGRGPRTRWRRTAATTAPVATADLDALGALAGTRASAAGADLRPAPPLTARAAPSTAAGPSHAARPGGAGLAPTNATIVGRWHEADDGRPVSVDHDSTFPLAVAPALAAARAAWTSAGSLTLAPGVERGPRCFANDETPDGRISVTYGDPCDEIPDTSPVLALGGAYFAADDVRAVNGRPYWRLTKGMVVVDGAPEKLGTLPPGCVAALLAHEIGHAIGLDHVAAPGAVMAAALPSGCVTETGGTALAVADLAAMAAAYPRPGEPAAAPGAPEPPTGLLAATVGATVTLAWGVPAGADPTGYEIHAGSSPGASDLAIVPVASTSIVAEGVGSGTYFVRVVAVHAAGASRPTPDVRVDVHVSQTDEPAQVRLAWSATSSLSAGERHELHGGRVLETPRGVVLDRGIDVVPATGDALTFGQVAPGAYVVRLVNAGPGGSRAVTAGALVVVPARP